MKRLITFCIISFGMLTASMAAEKHPADYVNPFVGTTNFGTTNPGAVCPNGICLLYTSPSPRDKRQSRMPSSA